jgi:hypothetical protein
MNTISIPGFSAQDSIYKTKKRYCMTNSFDSQFPFANIQPALPLICGVLSELVWSAYNEGAYNRGEFWLNVMERAGCFE